MRNSFEIQRQEEIITHLQNASRLLKDNCHIVPFTTISFLDKIS